MISAARTLVPPALLTAAAAMGAAAAPGLHRALDDTLGPAVAGGIGLALAAGAWLSAAWLGARALDLVFARAARAAGGAPVPRLLPDLVRVVLFGLALLAILALVFEQPVTGLVATSGVVIAVIGFALRNMISDIVSGLALNMEHPYRIGDWIEVAPGTVGRVDEINWRATRLITLEGVTVVVPNGLVAGSRFLNYSQPARSFRAQLTVRLDQDVPPARAKRVLLSAMVCAEGVLPEPRPDVLVESFNETGVAYQARFWVPDYGRLAPCRDAVGTAILQHLDHAGIALARAKHELHRAHPPHGTTARRRDLLAHVDLFGAFQPDELDALAAALVPRPVAAGEAVVRQDEVGSSLFVVTEGALEVRMEHEGRTLLLDRMRPGDVFGEMSLLTGQPRSASVVALTDALVCEMTKEHLDPVLRRRPELATRLAGLMAERQRRNVAHRAAGTRHAAAPQPAAEQDLLARVLAFFKL